MDFYAKWFMGLFCLGALIAGGGLLYIILQAFSRSTGEIGGWELRGAGRRIAAVTRTTLAEGLRAKVASGLALLVIASIPFFWYTAEGDGTLKGQVQMFIIYTLGLTSFLLALLTIFFSCRSLSTEIAGRQIYSIVTKPIPRWQILIGKWTGIMILNVVLLAIVSVAVLFGARTSISRFKSRLGHELITYSHMTPAQAETALAALDRVKGAGKKGIESPIVYAFADALGLTPRQIGEMLLRLPEPTRIDLRRYDEIRRQVLVARAAVVPERPDFREDVDQEYTKLKEAGRLPENWTDRQIREQLEKELVGGECTVPFNGGRRWRLRGPVPPKNQDDFLLSVRFKLEVSGDLQAVALPEGRIVERDSVLCLWAVGDPSKPTYVQKVDSYPARTFVEFEIPIDCVEPDGTIPLSYANIDPRRLDTVINLYTTPSNLEVLYSVGSFEMNLFHAFLAILVEIACLAACGVCASTFLSFPVGSLIMVSLFLISLCMPFITEAVAVTADYVPPDQQDFWFLTRRGMVDGLGWALSIGDCDPISKLGDGRVVDWPTLWKQCWRYDLLKGGLVMFIGIFIFRRRELAAVIV